MRQQILWIIEVTAVEIMDVGIPEEMRKITAMQAEAGREKIAKDSKSSGRTSSKVFDA